MFCSSCGTQTTEGLNFCKTCGANLNPQQNSIDPPRLVLSFRLVILFLSVAFVGAIIPIGVLGNLYDLKSVGVGANEITALVIVTAGVGLLTVALLVWLLVKLVGLASPEQPKRKRKAQNTAELPQRRDSIRGQLPAVPFAVGSVTEHTTRTFDRGRAKDQIEY